MAKKKRENALLLCAGLLLAAFMIYAGQPWKMSFAGMLGWVLGVVLFWVFNFIPFLILYSSMQHVNKKIPYRILSVAFVLMLVFLAYSLLSAFVLTYDAQNALVFVGLPIILVPTAIVFSSLAFIFERRL